MKCRVLEKQPFTSVESRFVVARGVSDARGSANPRQVFIHVPFAIAPFSPPPSPLPSPTHGNLYSLTFPS